MEQHFVAGACEILVVTGMGISGIEIAKEIRLLPGQRCTRIDLSPIQYEFHGEVVSEDGQSYNLAALFTVAPQGESEHLVKRFYNYLCLCIDYAGVQEAITGLIDGEIRAFVASITMAEMFAGGVIDELKNDLQTKLDDLGMVIGGGQVKPTLLGRERPKNSSLIDNADANRKGEIDSKKMGGPAMSITGIFGTRNLGQGCGAVGSLNYAMQKEFQVREKKMQDLWLMRGKENLAEKAAELMNPDDPTQARVIYDGMMADMELEQQKKVVEKEKNNTCTSTENRSISDIEKKTETLFLLDNLRGRATVEIERKVMPWLLLRSDNASSTLKLYNLEENRGEVKVIEELCEREICTACDGWAVVCDINSPKCFLLNLESLHKVDLPCPDEKIGYWICILSGPPTEIDSAVAFVNWDRSSIIYCGVDEDTGWKEEQLESYIDSMTVVKKKIFVLDENGRLMKLDISTGKRESSNPGIMSSFHFPYTTHSGYHMIELGGTLFLIASRMSGDINTPKDSRVEGVEVYKMDSVNEVWNAMSEIGDCAFLVAEDSNCASVIAREHVKANCVYFLKLEGSELKVFDLATNTISSIISLPEVPSRWVVMLSSSSTHL